MSAESLTALEARIYELETQAAFQEELLRRLDDTVASQDQELLQLKNQLKALAMRLSDLRDSAPGVSDSGHEVPPHY